MNDAKQNPSINPIAPKLTDNIRPSTNINSNSALYGIPSSVNISGNNSDKSSASHVEKKDMVAISPLADKLSRNTEVQKENILSNDRNKVVEEQSGREAVLIPMEREKTLTSASKSQEASSDMSLNKIKGEKEGYWDQLIIRDSMLVLQERLGGGMSARELALNSIGNMSNLLSQSNVSGGPATSLGGVAPIDITAGTKKLDNANAVEQLMRDYKTVQAKGAQLHESTQQMMGMAFRVAGIEEVS